MIMELWNELECDECDERDECDESDAWSWNALGFLTGGGSPDVSIVTTVAIDAMTTSICEGPARHCCPMFFHMPGQSGAKCEANDVLSCCMLPNSASS